MYHSTSHLLIWVLIPEDFELSSPLLKYEPNYVNYKFKILNDYLGFGNVGGFSRLRPHILRKFNATYLSQLGFDSNLNGMELVCLIQGRGKNRACEAYFKDNP